MDKELNDFIEQTFGATDTEGGNKPKEQEKTPVQVQQPSQPDDDLDIGEYLTDDEEPVEPSSPSENKVDTQAPQEKRELSAEERLVKAERELAALRAERDLLERFAQRPQEQQTQDQPKRPQTPFEVNPFDDGEIQIDPELQQTYGESMPFIQAVAKRAVQEYHDKYVKQQLGQYVNNIAQQVGGVSNALSQNQQQTLQQRIQSEIPEAVEIAQTPEWQGFLKTSPRLAAGGFTYGDLVQDAIRKGNIGMIKEAVADFKALRQGSQPQAVAPGKSGVATPSTAPRTKTLAYSKYVKATQDYEAGLISYDKFAKITDTFQDASIRGLVDYNR